MFLNILRVKGGTAGSPAIYFGEQDDSGLFSPTPGIVSVSADGVEVMRFEDTHITAFKPLGFPTHNKASLPSASPAGLQIYVPDDVGGTTMAFSDGTAWRRFSDRNVIS